MKTLKTLVRNLQLFRKPRLQISTGMASSSCSDKMPKGLLVFDFDHSLVDKNTDLHVVKLAPEGKVPVEIKQLYRDNGWMEYMSEIFKYLHKSGITQESILDCVSEIKLTEGMEELLAHTTKGNTFDHIIISDSNTVFISQILEKRNLSKAFLEVFTNPAKFLDNGLLTLKGYHYQESCSLSSENLCKGQILTTFLGNQKKASVEYCPIIYVGDGYNDLCPGLTLGQKDFLMPREKFKLNSLIEEMMEKDTPVHKSSLKATVKPWKTGLDILHVVQGKT